ncbi:MAG: ASKHA domain-containing protein, partial [Candidatus Thorarchaeota archaeon]
MTDSESLGISVDIGTSNLTLHLINLQSSQALAERVIPNPQSEYGDEIISRMDAARDSEVASRLASLVRQSIGNTINSMLIETMQSSDSVISIVVVGNTAMHHLFYKQSIASLLKPPYNADHKEAVLVPAADVDLPFSKLTSCYSPPIVESYVGADAVAMMIETGFPDAKKTIVSIDVGTNTEIAILKDHKIWIASAASGPAFEGMSVQCGISGGAGAISAVSIKK